MAKAEIKCTCPECGATHYWSITCHNRREADNWEQYHADDTDRLCPACYAKQRAAKREAEREAENKAAAERAASLALPALTGTEKQVAWATTIRQKALDEALTIITGRTSASLNDNGRERVAAAIGAMSTDARWWIDNRDGASHRLGLELEAAHWARLPDAKRAERLAQAEAAAGGNKLGPATLRKYRTMEAARLAGRSYAAQYAAEEEAAAAAKRAALPPKPAPLADRLGRPGARWNQKFYGRDGLRVYLDGVEVQVSAEIKSAWEREWREYNAAVAAAK